MSLRAPLVRPSRVGPVALALALLGCHDQLVETRHPPGTTGSTPSTPTTPTTTPPDGDPYAAAPIPPELSARALADIASGIDAIVDSTVASSGVMVVDADNGQRVYARDEDLPKKPASNTKLFTTGCAFDELGEEHRLQVTAWGDAAPDARGRVSRLTVVGEHDFTWSTFFYEDELFAADRLADTLWDAGLREVGTLVVAGEYEVEGYELGTYDEDAHRQDAVVVLEGALAGRGISVGSSTSTASFAPGAVAIGGRASPPLLTAAHPLNVYSHNEFADILSHHLGYELRGDSTFAAGTAEVVDWLDGLGVDTTGLSLNDGSGLSHANRVTPHQVVDLLGTMLDRPAGLDWRRTFSIGAVIGTLGGRMTSPDTAGRFYGKTGTLTGVIATSGVLFHRHDGHRYLVSILMNDVTDATFARSLQDQIVAVVGDDHRRLGARPERVVLDSVLAPGDGTLVVSWEPATDAQSYLVWFSDDGLVWDRSRARLVTGTRHVAGGLATDRTQYVRVTALDPAGEGDPSSVLAARTSHVPPSLLLVDGDDRWSGQPENPMGHGHDFLVAHAEAVGSRAFESVSHHLVDDGTVDPAAYDAVLWELGEQSSEDGTLSPAEQDALAAALDGGTDLLISGAELAWDLDWLGDAADRAFLSDVLHVAYAGDDAETHTTVPVAGGLLDGLPWLEFYTPGTQDVAFPDQLAPAAGGVAELTYVGGAGGTAAVSHAGSAGRTVVLGFPFEALDARDVREAVMERVLAFFGA